MSLYQALDLLQLLCIIAVLAMSRRTARAAFRSGYWTGKSEIHKSLGGVFAGHQEQLTQDPASIVGLLNDWYLEQMLGDQLIAKSQGFMKEEA